MKKKVLGWGWLERTLGADVLLQRKYKRSFNIDIRITESPRSSVIFRKWTSLGKDIGPYRLVLEKIEEPGK